MGFCALKSKLIVISGLCLVVLFKSKAPFLILFRKFGLFVVSRETKYFMRLNMEVAPTLKAR